MRDRTLNDQLAGVRGQFPEGGGQAEVPEAQARINIPTRSPFYIAYAWMYDYEPAIREQFPEGKQQYLNFLLREIEAGTRPWPTEEITNREQALEPLDEETIRIFFVSKGREQLGVYPGVDVAAFEQEVLGGGAQKDREVPKPAEPALPREGAEALVASAGRRVVTEGAARPSAAGGGPREWKTAGPADRWQVEPDFGGDEWKQQRAKSCIEAIHGRSKGDLHFLTKSGTIRTYADEFYLTVPELVYALGEDVLNKPEFATEKEQFAKLRGLKGYQLRQILGEPKQMTKAELLMIALIKLLSGEQIQMPEEQAQERIQPKAGLPLVRKEKDQWQKWLIRLVEDADYKEAYGTFSRIVQEAEKTGGQLTVYLLTQKTGFERIELAQFLYHVAQEMGYFEELKGELEDYRKENQGNLPLLQNLVDAVYEIYQVHEQALKAAAAKRAGKPAEQPKAAEPKPPAVTAVPKPEAKPTPPPERKEPPQPTFKVSGKIEGTEDKRVIEICFENKPPFKVLAKDFVDAAGLPEELKGKPEHSREFRHLLMTSLERLLGIPENQRTAEEKKHLENAIIWIAELMRVKRGKEPSFLEQAKQRATA